MVCFIVLSSCPDSSLPLSLHLISLLFFASFLSHTNIYVHSLTLTLTLTHTHTHTHTLQAILPLRGKILNIEKASTDKIYQNTELQSLIAAIGLGVRGTIPPSSSLLSFFICMLFLFLSFYPVHSGHHDVPCNVHFPHTAFGVCLLISTESFLSPPSLCPSFSPHPLRPSYPSLPHLLSPLLIIPYPPFRYRIRHRDSAIPQHHHHDGC